MATKDRRGFMNTSGRHELHLTDADVMLIARALKSYHQVMGIQTAVDVRHESDDTARISAVIQYHEHCECPHVEGGT
jgi:hypothetical protein